MVTIAFPSLARALAADAKSEDLHSGVWQKKEHPDLAARAMTRALGRTTVAHFSSLPDEQSRR
jgi:hypothetical protein